MDSGKAAIIVIVIAVVLIIPVQMILPFPFGLGMVFLLLILGIVGVIVAIRNHKKREKVAEESLKYQFGEDEPEKEVKEQKDDKSWDGI